MKAFVTIITAMFQFLPSFASIGDTLESKKRTYYLGGHFAGNTGLLAINGGPKFCNNRLVLGAGYGYLPQSVNGSEVHSIFLKTSYNFSKGLIYKKATWYTGFTTIYGITKNTFIKLPSWYPEKYYAPNAIHISPYIGLRLPFAFYKPGWAEKVFFHIELGALDTYLWYNIINNKVNFWDICNLSYGLYYDFYSLGTKNKRMKKLPDRLP